MSKVVHEEDGSHAIFCPACLVLHHWTGAWEYNGDPQSPTVNPSLIVTQNNSDYRCHFFIERGNIRFLADSHHKLAGRTVPLPDV